MTIGFVIKTIRETHGLSQTELANLCYRTKDWVYLIETNSPKTRVTKEDLVLLAEELKEPLLKTIAIGMNYEGLVKCMSLENDFNKDK